MDFEKFGITEEQLNAGIDEEKWNLKFEIKKEEPIIEKRSVFDEYTLDDRGWDEQLRAQEINMNQYSMSFFIKSLFCDNSGAVYVSTFINFFQDLEPTTLEKANLYSSHSHAITFFILKALEKNGAIKIIEYHTSTTESLTIEEKMNNTPKKAKIKIYDVLFYKMRDLTKEDKEVIKDIEKALRINKRQIKVRFFDDELYTKLGILEILKCIFTGHIFIQFKKNLTYWKEAEGFKNDISNVLYNLKRTNKPTTK